MLSQAKSRECLEWVGCDCEGEGRAFAARWRGEDLDEMFVLGEGGGASEEAREAGWG